MDKFRQILDAKIKPKEKISILAKALAADKKLINQLVVFFEKAKDSEKGTCLAALAGITKNDPKYIEAYLDFVIAQIAHKAPRVKWESSEIIAKVAREFPEKVVKVIPKLVENINAEGTVVRWSAAYALTEIAKNNSKTRPQLIPIFADNIKKENNNGVKKIYLKALKALEKAR